MEVFLGAFYRLIQSLTNSLFVVFHPVIKYLFTLGSWKRVEQHLLTLFNIRSV